MRIDLLDMGNTRYGDCLLIRQAKRSILIDGAHPGDTASIESQLEQLFGHAAPFALDLLVVTHCHSDHIGCLPALVAAETIRPKIALVADERLGFGRAADGVGPTDGLGLSRTQRMLVAGLQEEGYADLPADQLEQQLAEDLTLEEKYIGMLEQLRDSGCRIVRYGRSPDTEIRSIEAEFSSFGLQVLGPTTDHLVICASAITAGTDMIAQAVLDEGVGDESDALSLAAAYRSLTRRFGADAPYSADRPGVGAAKNNQSIVLKVSAGGWSSLLAGDMQFAQAEVPGLDDLMGALRQAANAAGPYDFIKLTHHASYNGLDEEILGEWSATKLFAHTGGLNDTHHPDPGVLALLKQHHRDLTLARTDRNGIISVQKNGTVRMEISKGRANDFTENEAQDLPELAPSVNIEPARVVATTRASDRDVVEVIARVPHRRTKVTLTIQIEPEDPAVVLSPSRPEPRRGTPPVERPEVRDRDTIEVGGGRSLPALLMLTSRPRLEKSIGAANTTRILSAVAQVPGVTLLEVPAAKTTPEAIAKLVRTKLSNQISGVVILGGFNVIPAQQLDVLDPKLRKEVEASRRGKDADDFIVWSDEIYGDTDEDGLPELPVSRIPDGNDADVLQSALEAQSFVPGSRFGVRNYARPFAVDVFGGLPGSGETLEVSEMFGPHNVLADAAKGAVYYMLHGSDRDATRFWGETQGGDAYEAFSVENVPPQANGSVVFTGCCWGALTTTPPAARAKPGAALRALGPKDSIAMAYLQAGALAFVGCTGSHYSPQKQPYDYFGKPMHDAFWTHMASGKPPAQALFLAKQDFTRGLPHGQTEAFERAIELKILRQYTCLGLGW